VQEAEAAEEEAEAEERDTESKTRTPHKDKMCRISTSLHLLYLMVRDAFPIIILNLTNNLYVSTC